MHLHFERNSNAKCDCPILSLTWMGKVPDELPEDEGWKLNRTNYYQEGWLATGNVRGIVGVTFTTSHCKKTVDYPLRTNYNLRGHRSEVILVKWNEPYQKLASCDSSGIIFVWIKYEGRWSIELINDRSTPVTHFAWSHDGRMALICYQDGFVLVGSVAGQRYWSSMLNLDSTITCGIWTPDDLHVYFGTSSGGLVVMDVHGAMVAQIQLAQAPVTGMAWSCEKFKMEEGDECDILDTSTFVLAVSVSTGHIFLMKSYDDVSPVQFYTGLGGPLCMEWSNSRQLLAVAGVANHSADNTDYVNMLQCYSDNGVLLYSTVIPYNQSPVTALTWGHNDKRLFVATGGIVHIAWVSRRVASLQLMSRLQVATMLPDGEASVRKLPLPPKIKHLIANLFAQTIRCCVPGVRGIREFVSRPPLNGTRLHCTMIKHDEENTGSSACYTLYLEYLGGLVPLLKGKRVSKIRPEFVIFDPEVDENMVAEAAEAPIKLVGRGSDTSDTEREDGCSGSPRMQRRRKKRNRSPEYCEELAYVDTLPENARLVEVTSNIWGTKFKIHGLADCVPSNLGQVTYKTSLLHLQPRQMSLVMTELRDDVLLVPDPSFNPNVFSEDEDDERGGPLGVEPHFNPTGAIPIAPMTPKNLRQRSRFLGTGYPNSAFFRARAQQPVRNTSFVDENLASTSSRLPTPRTPGYPDTRFFRSEATTRYVRLPCSPPSYHTKTFLPVPDQQDHLEQQRSRRHRQQHQLVEQLLSPPTEIPSYESLQRRTMRSRSEERSERHHPLRNQSFLNAQSLSLQAQSDLLSSNSSNQPSVSPCDTPLTYQAEIDRIVKRLDEMIELQSPLARPESVEDEAPYTDCNLNDLISFCESYRPEPADGVVSRQRRLRRTPEKNETCFLNQPPPSAKMSDKVNATGGGIVSGGPMSRSCSVGFLDDVDRGMVPCQLSLILLKSDAPKRLFLVRKKPTRKPKSSHSLDSNGFFALRKSDDETPASKEGKSKEMKTIPENSVNSKKLEKDETEQRLQSELPIQAKNRSLAHEEPESKEPPSPPYPLTLLDIQRCAKAKIEQARSQPASPMMAKKKRNQSASPIRKHILNSPLLRRRRKSRTESSDDDIGQSGDEAFTNKGHYKDLETFQKAQLMQKLKRGKVGDGLTPRVRELVMHNKAPMWNENSQVYQLDFGGRVTQESAKNFQIEFNGKQVMQFGRIDGNAYTLDFQYPFSVLQAFAVALANVTQRLK